jgi:hypothetical protein
MHIGKFIIFIIQSEFFATASFRLSVRLTCSQYTGIIQIHVFVEFIVAVYNLDT